jgi:aryl-alcohol dehydrogenase-like predicted oxidoreductase
MNEVKNKKRIKLPHEKAILKNLIDADMNVQDVANFYEVTSSAVCQRILRNDTRYVNHAIQEVKASRSNKRISA